MGSPATKKASARTPSTAPTAPTPRLAPEEREQLIVQKAIRYFAEYGFGASTRDLAKEIGVSQPLLYRYFPNKQALADRVFEEVYLSRWNPEWEEILADRKRPLADRLHQFYQQYSKVILQRDWIRIFIHAGLSREGINSRYLTRLRERIFNVVLAELRREFKVAEPTEQQYEDEIEFVWGLHAAIFYVGMRKSVYGLPVPQDIERLIDQKLQAFLASAPSVLKNIRK
ncbi:TetR family transcriptional regulator [Pseudoduganella sp. FT25W]|uniref:TetR family transcriptional regulator n=1 Tax=Duganella alba TaxID=2666081 RepID=A0A6L5QMW3_9BURK|nr:TetR/AcrR family transcriptional regulator [Duganella alba]MRX10311.1 TetR family transcriptional regulator [Duganella alba]MRX18598.1 TetR family transcriptional regulator [Duganella alba]